jgi:hypothetical protein
MPPTRPRRIVRRRVIALAAPLLFLYGYITAWWCFCWLLGANQISTATAKTLNATVFAPAHFYVTSQAPGGHLAKRIGDRLYEAGLETQKALIDRKRKAVPAPPTMQTK